MGQCYTVYLKMKLKDADEFVNASRKFAEDNYWGYDYIAKMTSVDKIIKYFVGGTSSGVCVDYEDGWPVFRGDYDACYSWDGTLENWFHAIAPSLEDGSEIEVYPDTGRWKCVVHDGKVDKTYDEAEDEDEEEEEV